VLFRHQRGASWQDVVTCIRQISPSTRPASVGGTPIVSQSRRMNGAADFIGIRKHCRTIEIAAVHLQHGRACLISTTEERTIRATTLRKRLKADMGRRGGALSGRLPDEVRPKLEHELRLIERLNMRPTF